MMKKKQILLLEHYLDKDNMNFKEFDQLINSGAEKITLTEDVILQNSETENYMGALKSTLVIS